MKTAIHPQWFSEAVVICACGNSWTTGATIAEIRTDICSQCHPFYTGEQRIVDTEGQVDRFHKRLQAREAKRQEVEERIAARTPLNLPLSSLDLNKRYVTTLSENNVNTVSDFLTLLEEKGEEGFLEMPGIGRKIIGDVKKLLRARGYDVPRASDTAE